MKLMFIIENKFKECLGKNHFNFRLLVKIFRLTRFLFEYAEANGLNEKELLMKNLKRMQFSMSYYLKFWRYDEHFKK